MLARRAFPDIQYAAELSGGIDSTFATLVASRAWGGGGVSLGIDIGFGRERQPQLARRQRVIRATGCQDILVDIRAHMPSFAMRSTAIESQYLLSEEYEGAFAELSRLAKNAGCNVITGGYGGDELFPILTSEEERPNKLRGITPAEVSNVKALFKTLFTDYAWQAVNDGFFGELDPGYLGKTARLAVVKRAPLMLAHGFWPVFPLYDEKLAAYMLSTTIDERHEKAALQDAITVILNEQIFGNYEKETLLSASELSTRLHAPSIARELEASRLIDLGIIRDNPFPDRLGDLSVPSSPYLPVLSALFATEKFVRHNLNDYFRSYSGEVSER